ncbi:hypothetical protein ACJV2T_04610 [Gardnerella sp. Marseille-Q9179]|uniref:hypothetical protein n=1 Tax=Gardnerella TaxID=2701 RepID=UPI0039EDF025
MPSLLGLTSLFLSSLFVESAAALSSFAAGFSFTEPVAPLTSLSSSSPFAFLSSDTSFVDLADLYTATLLFFTSAESFAELLSLTLLFTASFL